MADPALQQEFEDLQQGLMRERVDKSEAIIRTTSDPVLLTADEPSGPQNTRNVEIDGPKGPEPTRYGDWSFKGRVTDF